MAVGTEVGWPNLSYSVRRCRIPVRQKISIVRGVQPRCARDDLGRRDGVKHMDIDVQAMVWRGATAWKAVADASTSALRALPANACAALRRRARSRSVRALLPRAGRGARTLLITRCPYARCPILSVRATRLLGSPRSCPGAGGRRARRPTTRRPSPITYEFGRKRRSGRRCAAGCARRATRWAAFSAARGAVLLGYSSARSSCARCFGRQPTILGWIGTFSASWQRASAGLWSEEHVGSDASGARVE